MSSMNVCTISSRTCLLTSSFHTSSYCRVLSVLKYLLWNFIIVLKLLSAVNKIFIIFCVYLNFELETTFCDCNSSLFALMFFTLPWTSECTSLFIPPADTLRKEVWLANRSSWICKSDPALLNELPWLHNASCNTKINTSLKTCEMVC